jgi:hypothetical protein
MNRNDKNSLQAFKSMFGVLSRGIKRKFEARANDRSAESGLPFVTIGDRLESANGNVRNATPEENAVPALKSERTYLKLVTNPAPGESFVQFCGADTFPDGGIDTSSSRTPTT